MATEDYILSFDFESVTRQITELSEAYSSLSSEFNKVADTADSRLESLNSKVISISANLGTSLSKIDQFYSGLNSRLGVTSNHFKDLEQYSKSVYENFNKISQVDLEKGSGKPGGQDSVKDRQEAISGFAMAIETDGSKESLTMAQAALAAAQKAKKEAEEAKSAVGNLGKKIKDTIAKEMASAKSKAKGIMGGFSGGALAGGGLMAMLGMIILGQKEKQRKGAEAGEMLNAFESMGNIFSKETQKANRWFSKFAEHAQYHFGIGRKEIQGVVQAMGEAGFKDVLDSDFNQPITKATANVVTSTIALDKLLNQATGTTMQRSIELSTQYNQSLETSVNQYTKLSMVARSANMDFNKFIETVMAGKSSVAQYGIELGTVSGALLTLKKRYKEMGLSDQMAGGMAAKGIQGVMNVIGNLPDNILGPIGMKYLPKFTGQTPGNATSASVMMHDLFASGANSDEVFAAVLNELKEKVAVGKTDEDKRFALKDTLGTDHDTARALLELIKRPRNAQGNVELTAEEKEQRDAAFTTEGRKLTDIQKHQRDLIDALAKTGEGLLKVLTSILGILTAGVLGLPIMVQMAGQYLSGDTAAAEKTFNAYGNFLKSQTDTFTKGLKETWAGVKDVGKVTGDTISDMTGGVDQLEDLIKGLGWSSESIVTKVEEALDAAHRAVTDVDSLKELTADFTTEVNYRLNQLADAVLGTDEADAYKSYMENDAQNKFEQSEDRRSGKKAREGKYSEKDLGKGRSFVPDSNIPSQGVGVTTVLDWRTVATSNRQIQNTEVAQ